jgi:hypothetical protein
MVELVDTLGSGSSERMLVRVRIPLAAKKENVFYILLFYNFLFACNTIYFLMVLCNNMAEFFWEGECGRKYLLLQLMMMS